MALSKENDESGKDQTGHLVSSQASLFYVCVSVSCVS